MSSEFKVLKYDTVTKLCPQCGGVGYKLVKNRNGTFKNPCPHCIEGKYRSEIRTEVTLLEALRELKLIN